MIAGAVIYIHVQLLRDVWQIWTYQLKYWSWTGFALQFAFCMGIFVLIALGIYHQQCKCGRLYNNDLFYIIIIIIMEYLKSNLYFVSVDGK